MTPTDLALRALRKRGVYSASENLSAADQAFMDQSFTVALAEIERHDLQGWLLTDTPDKYADAFLSYAEPLYAGAFGFDVGDVAAVQRAALVKLRELIAPRRKDYPKPNEYF